MEHLTTFDAARITALRQADDFAWIDLERPDDATLADAGRLLGIPPLALEDSHEMRQRPKVDDHGRGALVVFYGAQGDALAEVHLHVSGTEVLTVRDGPVDALAGVDVTAARSEQDLVYRLVDALSESLVALVERRMAEVQALEEAAYEHPTDGERRRIAEVRSELFRLGQVIGAQRDVLADNARVLECLPGLEGDTARHPFRDVHDDLVQTAAEIAYGRELLAEALQAHLAAQGNRLNEVATRLSLVATIFLPLTFVTGFFGQNFGWLTSHIGSPAEFFALGIGGCALAVALPVVVYWRAGLLGRRRPRL